MGVIGLVSNPLVWASVTTEPSTSAMAYCTFVEHVLNTYNAIANLAAHWTLINNNLTLHKATEVYQAIRECRHHVVCCPPYRPQDGLIEYAINQVCGHLEKCWSEVNNLQTMKTVVVKIIDNDIHSMDEMLLQCDYICIKKQ